LLGRGTNGTVTRLTLLSLLAGVAFVTLIGATLFGCAGRTDLPLFWSYLGIWAAAALVGPFVLDQGLIRERLRPGRGGKDSLIGVVAAPLWLGSYVVAGLDVGRYHWSDAVPFSAQVLGILVMAAGVVVVTRAAAVNPFASTVIRIQRERGHHVITSGPYRFVRHPMYACCIPIFLGGALALGSWWAALPRLAIILLILRRTAVEDRTLLEQLAGYTDYAGKVRYRIIPGVW
jgi:protein-S-isoprenylcysteine O-methyltransferase Ste14